MLDFVGCPPRSTFNSDTLACDCPEGEFYDTEIFQCYKKTGLFDKKPDTYQPDSEVEEKSEDVVTKEDSSAESLRVCFALHTILLFIVYCFYP